MRAPEPWPPVITLSLSRQLQMPCPPGHNLLAIHIVVPSLISHSSPFGPSPESPSGPKPTRPRAPDMIILLYIIHPRLPGHQIPALCTITFSSSRQWPKSRPPGNQITGPQLRIITFPALRASGRSHTHPIQRSKPSPFPIFQAKLWNLLPKSTKEQKLLDPFKKSIADYLDKFPDTPPTRGYMSTNNNSLLCWAREGPRGRTWCRRRAAAKAEHYNKVQQGTRLILVISVVQCLLGWLLTEDQFNNLPFKFLLYTSIFYFWWLSSSSTYFWYLSEIISPFIDPIGPLKTYKYNLYILYKYMFNVQVHFLISLLENFIRGYILF